MAPSCRKQQLQTVDLETKFLVSLTLDSCLWCSVQQNQYPRTQNAIACGGFWPRLAVPSEWQERHSYNSFNSGNTLKLCFRADTQPVEVEMKAQCHICQFYSFFFFTFICWLCGTNWYPLAQRWVEWCIWGCVYADQLLQWILRCPLWYEIVADFFFLFFHPSMATCLITFFGCSTHTHTQTHTSTHLSKVL